MTSPALIERITRSLAYMLRHQPEEFDLQLDSHGFGDVDAVVHALNERLAEPVDRSDLEAAISSGDRPRYEIRGDRVRALYGHSIDVEPGEPSKPPEFLYVGVSDRDADRAMRFGLRGGRRRFLHLALTPEDAKEGGRRTGRDYVVITVYALDAWEEGINFYDRQALFLAEQIPTEFLEISETCHDGFDRPAFGHPAGRGSGDEHREHRPERAPRPERAEPARRADEPAAAWAGPTAFEAESSHRDESSASEPRGEFAGHDRVAERGSRDNPDRGGRVAEHVGHEGSDRGPRDSRGRGGRDSGDRGGRGGRRGGRGRGDRPPMGAPSGPGEGFARDRGERPSGDRPGGEHRERSPERAAGPYSGPPRGEQGHRDSGGGARPHRDARPDSRPDPRDHGAPRDARPEGREREREPNRRPDFRDQPPREPRRPDAAPARPAPPQPAPEVRKRAESTAVPGSFGLGIFEEPKAPQRAKPPSPPPQEARREAPPPPPEEPYEEPEKKSGGGGFGAGI